MANIAGIRDNHVLSFFLLDDKTKFHLTLRAFAFSGPSKERCRVHLAGIFRPHVVVFEAQTAPWVTLLNFGTKDSGPIPTQQSSPAGKGFDGYLIPVFFPQLKSCFCLGDGPQKIVFFFFSFVLFFTVEAIFGLYQQTKYQNTIKIVSARSTND